MGRALDAIPLKNEVGGVLAVWYREWKVFTRERSRIVSSLVSPLLWLVVFGGGVGASVKIPGVNYQAFIYPGILAQSVLFSSVFFGVYIVWDRKIDFLKEVLVAPISRTAIFVGKVVGGATDAMVQSLMLLVIGMILARTGLIPGLTFGVVQAVLALLVLAITTTSLVSVGLIVGSMMESPEGFQFITSFLIFPTFFLSGALFPIANLPRWLAPFVVIDPLTYSVDALRYVLLDSSHFPLAADLAAMIAFTAITIVVGTFAFERMKV